MNKHLYVTILAGGAGTRFWPASRKGKPKQLLPLATSRPMLLETVDRALKLVPAERIRIIAGVHLQESIEELVTILPPESFKIEPLVRGTAAALTWASWELHQLDPQAIILSLHADHVINPEERFVDLIGHVASIAETGDSIFTISINPNREETGYGYIEPGRRLESKRGIEIFEVNSFNEKPDLDTVRKYLNNGYLWNSGIFLWKAGDFLDEINAVTPEISDSLYHLEADKPVDFYKNIPVMTVDEGILERSNRVATVLADFEWDDIGTWSSLDRVRKKDENGNILMGDCKVLGTSNSVVYSEDVTFVAHGVKDLVLVQSGDIVLATTKELATDLKTLLAHLSSSDNQVDS